MLSLAKFKKDTLLRGRLTATGRAVLKAAAVAAEPFDYYLRRRVASQYNKQFPSDRMSKKDGFARLPSGSLPGTTEILETCRQIFASKKAALDAATPTLRDQKKKKSFLRDLLDNDDLRANPILVDFALSDPLFSIATNYLGVIPTLNRGEAAVVDTSRCLHAGSRVRPGHFWLVLFIQYCTTHEKGQTFEARRFRVDRVRWLALERFASPDS